MGEREFAEWSRFAQDDLEVARLLMGMEPRKIEIICYHCQQSAEKHLKALLARIDAPVPRTHDLLNLLDLVTLFHPSLKDMAPALARLQPFAIAVRYPFELSIPEGFESKVLEAAETVARFIRESASLE